MPPRSASTAPPGGALLCRLAGCLLGFCPPPFTCDQLPGPLDAGDGTHQASRVEVELLRTRARARGDHEIPGITDLEAADLLSLFPANKRAGEKDASQTRTHAIDQYRSGCAASQSTMAVTALPRGVYCPELYFGDPMRRISYKIRFLFTQQKRYIHRPLGGCTCS